MPAPTSGRDDAAPNTESARRGDIVNFPQDPRCHMLAVVLLAGHALRMMNHVRDNIDGGLSGTLILLDILQAERESRAGIRMSAAAPGSGPPLPTPRSILAITAAVDVPRETVRRIAAALASAGWLQAAPQGGYETSGRARRWFGLDHDPVPYAEFVWTAREVTAALTVTSDGVDALVGAHSWLTALATRREAVPSPAYLKTMPALQETLGRATADDKERAAAVVDGFLYRHLKRLRATFEGDLLLPLIIGEIAHRNIAMLGHRGDTAQQVTKIGSRFGSDSSDLRGEFLPTNAYSLSQSMGVPDATMRRKIAHLRMREWISVDAEGNLAVIGETVRRHSERCNLDALNDMVAGYRRLVATGMAS
jgi:hypothetical protein